MDGRDDTVFMYDVADFSLMNSMQNINGSN